LSFPRAVSSLAPLLAIFSVERSKPSVAVESLVQPAGYQLVWSDEFETAGFPDPRRWTYDTDYNRTGWHNDEAQYYSNRSLRNARVEDGALIIEAHAEELRGRRDWGGQAFTSARLVTRGRASWRYGYIEVRAKLPCVRGTWPAIWMLPADRSAQFEHGEIDIMEHVGHRPGAVLHSLQTRRRNHRRGNHPVATSQLLNVCDAFHTYQLHWTPDRILIGTDGRPALSYARTPGVDWPFNRSFYLILNLAIGGAMSGGGDVETAAFPARFIVDYVRVYEAPAS
jgi:beta-glucanase (GH16 family)